MFQKLIIAGNLGGDPELRSTTSGQSVCSFSVATNRRWQSAAGERQEETVWFRVSVWGKMGEVCKQYLTKGQKVLCEGRLSPDRETGGPRIWTDQAGKARSSFEMTATEVRFLSSRGEGASAPRADAAFVGAEAGGGGGGGGSYGGDSLGSAVEADMPF